MSQPSIKLILTEAFKQCFVDKKDSLRLSDFILDYCYPACDKLNIIELKYSFYNDIHEYLLNNLDLAKIEERSSITYIYLNKKIIARSRNSCNNCD